jgi:chaperonin GroEL
MLEDLAIVTGGRVIARELGGRIEQVTLRDLGTARQVRVTADQTVISGGGGDPMAIAARREQVARLMELAPPNIDRDKLAQRLSRLAGGTAMILAGGATPVEQKRRAELIEDAIHAARAAAEEGIVPGGGTALLQVAAEAVIGLEGLSDGVRRGALLLQTALAQPLAAIAMNCGLDPEAVIARVRAGNRGIGLDARDGSFADMLAAGIVDPVKVSISAVRNASSVAALILTTQTLIAKKPDYVDPTAGPALGGGAERLGRA